MTVSLGPCVSDEEARLLLRAIRDQRVVNRQQIPKFDSAAGPAGEVPRLPVINVGLVSSIYRSSPDVFESPQAPAHQYTVTITDKDARHRGLLFYVNVRDEQVELVGYGHWIY